MAQVLDHIWCMFPNLGYLPIEGWVDVGNEVTIVESEGQPANTGDSHCAKLDQGKATANVLRSIALPDTGILKATVAIKFSQRDIYLNENPFHYFFQVWDNAGANRVAALYYEGIAANNNRIGIEDSVGTRTVLDTGPFVADIWYTFDNVFRHLDSTAWFLFRNGVFQASATGMDFFTASGDVEYRVYGQLENGPPGPGGSVHVTFVAHYTDATVAAEPLTAKYLFRPDGYYGEAVCDHEGNTPAPALFTGSGADIADLADTKATYRGTGVSSANGGAWPCDRGVKGPGGVFPGHDVTPVAVQGCYWTDHATKGGDDDDPHTLIGKANNDLDTFTIVETDIDRGVNVKSQKLLLPGDTGFPDASDFLMLGILERQAVSAGQLGLEETIGEYLVLDTVPPLTQIRCFGDTKVLGETVGAGA